MAGRIVLFGATGYTGRLTAEAMVARGLEPVLAARSAAKLADMATELGGGLETALADVADPPTVADLVERGDVLVSTVGPFMRFGHPAAAAASTKGAHYLDSTGEPPFIRSVFERYDPVARESGCGMLTAFGYDFVPGNLAGALALREAGEDAVRVDTGYFFTGGTGAGDMSGGTRASLAGVMTTPSFAWRDGRIRTERGARRYRSFDVGGRDRPAVSVGASDHFGLPRVAPLREVNAYLGWFGPASRPMQAMSAGMALATKLPGASTLIDAVTSRVVPEGSTGGPDAEARARSGSHVVGIAYDAADRPLAEVHLRGVNGYEFTGRILAWGAERAAASGLRGTGALDPVDGFGLDELREGCADAGLEVVREAGRPAGRSPQHAPARA